MNNLGVLVLLAAIPFPACSSKTASAISPIEIALETAVESADASYLFFLSLFADELLPASVVFSCTYSTIAY